MRWVNFFVTSAYTISDSNNSIIIILIITIITISNKGIIGYFLASTNTCGVVVW